jgi:hypothetical protein
LSDTTNGQAVQWADFDNDGNLDIFVGRCDQIGYVLFGEGPGAFYRSYLAIPGTDGCTVSAVCGDFDADGRVDIYLVNDDGPNALLRNQIQNENHWLQFELQGTESNASAIGARLKLSTGTGIQSREVTAGSGNFSQNPLAVTFGLGAADRVDWLEIRWPSGGVDVLTDLAVDRIHRITEGEDTAIEDPEIPNGEDSAREEPARLEFRLHRCSPNPFNPLTEISFTVGQPQRVRLSIYDLSGRLVTVVKDQFFGPGTHHAVWSGRDRRGHDVPSGGYIVRMESVSRVDSEKVQLVR